MENKIEDATVTMIKANDVGLGGICLISINDYYVLSKETLQFCK